MDLFTLEMVRSSVRLTTPILLATMGSALCNRAGVLNLAIEGKMLVGAFGGAVMSYLLTNALGGAAFAMLCGALIGVLFSVLASRFEIDLVVLAIAVNLLFGELTVYFMRSWYGVGGSWRDPSIRKLGDITIPGIDAIPVVGDVLSRYNLIVYLSWLFALGYWLLFRTRFGRHVLAVGEAPEAAAAAGIDVERVRMAALAICGALAGLAGAYLSVGNLALFSRYMTNGRGWLAVTAALLALNRPLAVVLAAWLFGLADAVSFQLQATSDIPASLVQFFPVGAAFVALVVVGIRTTYGRTALSHLLGRRPATTLPDTTPQARSTT